MLINTVVILSHVPIVLFPLLEIVYYSCGPRWKQFVRHDLIIMCIAHEPFERFL